MSVNACLCPVVSVHGCAVTTVEGIGNTRTRPHPVQACLAEHHGSQCGFCTPGIVMSAYTMLRSLPRTANENDLQMALQGNLCRCTGYRPILEGLMGMMSSRSCDSQSSGDGCPMGEQCCKTGNVGRIAVDDAAADPSNYGRSLSQQEPIFPPEFVLTEAYDQQRLVFRGRRTTWYRPMSLPELLELKSEHSVDAQIVVGNTEIGIEVKFKGCQYPVMIQPNKVPELNVIKKCVKGIIVGAAVTIDRLESELNQLINTMLDYKVQVIKALLDMIPRFASKQIRNVACIAGNIVTGSPASDLNPIFLAARCRLKVQSKKNGTRILKMDDTFFTGYRTNILRPDEVIIDLLVPFTEKNAYFKSAKQSRRRDDDIALVNGAFYATVSSDGTVTDAELAFGGVSATAVVAQRARSLMVGGPWSEAMLDAVCVELLAELPLPANAPGGMSAYRRTLTLSLFFKFYCYVRRRLNLDTTMDIRGDGDRDGDLSVRNEVARYAQYYQVVTDLLNPNDPVGRPLVHKSAVQQTTGEAVYCDDIPRYADELYLAVKTSTYARAKIIGIDYAEVLSHPGVVTVVDEKDLPGGRNMVGVTPIKDDYVFARETVVNYGQIVCALVAVDPIVAQEAIGLIRVRYEELKPIITIEEAIKNESFYDGRCVYWEKGCVDQGLSESQYRVDDTLRIGGQDHFYLETQCCIVIPMNEHDEIEIISSTQSPGELQETVAHCLDVPANRVVCRTKRVGGGFGGKETKGFTVAVPCAVAAVKTGKPVRCMLDRHEDMVITGGRNPFLFRYRVGFDEDGTIRALDVSVYNNAGSSRDLSVGTMERCASHITNAYYVPHVRVSGYACATNLASNTAFRGFGAPQGMFFAESVVERVAAELGAPANAVRERNFIAAGRTTVYGQLIRPEDGAAVGRCWREVLDRSEYVAKSDRTEQFNRANRWKKRGVAAVPTVYGIGFAGGSAFLNQAGALVLVYADGSVLLAHGGVEMGQGLHTKMIQVAGRALGVPAGLVHVRDTGTDKVANASPTAGSFSSDLNGMAVVNACNIINERLKPIKEKNPTGSWVEWVKTAYFEKVNLCASGFYADHTIGSITEQGTVNYYLYYTSGAAVSVVEVDCLTGDHEVLSTDIVMDVGRSLNPAIDVGQIEGAFMQGYGLFTLEELVYSPKGVPYTRGPGSYKIPGFSDIPRTFTVSLLEGTGNPRAVYSSKAVGEPPLFLSASVFFAIKNAVGSARRDANVPGHFRLDAPATVEKIRMACVDHITGKIEIDETNQQDLWNVVV